MAAGATVLASAAAVMGSVLRSGQSGRFAMPLRSLSREEVRQVDEKAIAMGLPGVVLMENAALGLTDVVCDELAARDAGPGAVVGIITGKGNNGGDGFVLARHLVLRGYVARVAYCGDRSTCKRETDAGINLSVLESSRMAEIVDVADGAALASLLAGWSDASLLVDAIYGTGLSAHLRPEGIAFIEALNGAEKPVVAVDLPSGIDTDSGLPLGAAVKACRTVTFVARKKGFDQPGAEAWTGPIDVIPIGCPPSAWDHVQ
jgi:hydroxyethylthiazole kinase-like uncharacterized protein yjeF